MKKFKEFLTEGGNVKIGDTSSEPISIGEREKKAKDIKGMLHSINKASGHKLFGKEAKGIESGSIYGGSSHHMMNEKIPTKELKKHKKSFGDVDVQVPKEHKADVESHLKPGSQHGKFTVVGTHKHGEEITAVMKHEDGKHHQVDFEYSDFHNHEPTPFSKLGHISHYEDLKNGLKGAAHKHLLNAVTHANTDRKYSFSGAKGVKEKADKKAPYDTDLSSIHHKLFGKKPTGSDIEDMHSFHGVTRLMKKHFGHEQIGRVIHDYTTSGYEKGMGAEGIKMKNKAVKALKKTFPEHFKGNTP